MTKTEIIKCVTWWRNATKQKILACKYSFACCFNRNGSIGFQLLVGKSGISFSIVVVVDKMTTLHFPSHHIVVVCTIPQTVVWISYWLCMYSVCVCALVWIVTCKCIWTDSDSIDVFFCFCDVCSCFFLCFSRTWNGIKSVNSCISSWICFFSSSFFRNVVWWWMAIAADAALPLFQSLFMENIERMI